MRLSVIICSHNPRESYLKRVLTALNRQTLPKEQWELLLIDNVSKVALSQIYDLTWHPLARHIREEEIGLTPARLRGIKEAAGDLLVFVDDDNVLDPDYLQCALEIETKHQMLGVWGGSCQGEFEITPPEWIAPYLSALAVSEVKQDQWSNVFSWALDNFPPGAGLCIRSCVAKQYAMKLYYDPIRRSLDRSGTSLISGGDGDLGLVSLDMGLGMGSFANLKLTHLIPKERLSQEYIIRLYAGFGATRALFNHVRPVENEKPQTLLGRLRSFKNYWTNGKLNRMIIRASNTAKNEMVSTLSKAESPITRRPL